MYVCSTAFECMYTYVRIYIYLIHTLHCHTHTNTHTHTHTQHTHIHKCTHMYVQWNTHITNQKFQVKLFVISRNLLSEQFPMRYCSTWLKSLLCYIKKFVIEEFVIRVLHCTYTPTVYTYILSGIHVVMETYHYSLSFYKYFII